MELKFFCKTCVHNGFETPWHQDGTILANKTTLATCTVWLAIDDATEENGCLRFIKGSHKNKKLKDHYRNNKENLTLHQELNKNEYDISKSVNLLLARSRTADLLITNQLLYQLSYKGMRNNY